MSCLAWQCPRQWTFGSGEIVFQCVQCETSGAIHYHRCFGLEAVRITRLHCFLLLQCHAISASRPKRYCRTMGPSAPQEHTWRYWLLLKVSDKKIDGAFENLWDPKLQGEVWGWMPTINIHREPIKEWYPSEQSKQTCFFLIQSRRLFCFCFLIPVSMARAAAIRGRRWDAFN